MDAQYNHSLMRSNEILDCAMFFVGLFWTDIIKSMCVCQILPMGLRSGLCGGFLQKKIKKILQM